MKAKNEINCVMFGDIKSGKTALRICVKDSNAYSDSYEQTIGVGFSSISLQCEGQEMMLGVADVAGREPKKEHENSEKEVLNFQEIETRHIRSADFFMVAVDLSVANGLEKAQVFLDYIYENYKGRPIILTGTKSDLEKKVHVNLDELQKKYTDCTLDYIETSSKKNIGVLEVFQKGMVHVSEQKNNNNKQHKTSGCSFAMRLTVAKIICGILLLAALATLIFGLVGIGLVVAAGAAVGVAAIACTAAGGGGGVAAGLGLGFFSHKKKKEDSTYYVSVSEDLSENMSSN